MKRVPSQRVAVRVGGALVRAEVGGGNDRVGNRTHIELLGRPPTPASYKSGWRPFHFRKETTMPGRGPQTFKKRQKEQHRKERQQEKMAKRLARKHESAGAATGKRETAVGEAKEELQRV